MWAAVLEVVLAAPPWPCERVAATYRGESSGHRRSAAAGVRDDRRAADHQRLLLRDLRGLEADVRRLRPRRAAISITAIVTVAYLLASGTDKAESGGEGGLTAIDWIIVGLLVVAMANTFRGRHDTEPPRWMGKLQGATPKVTFVLGLLLLGLFPSDLITSITVGSHLGNDGDPWLHSVPFVAFTLLLLASPALTVAMLGERARILLPKARDWMNRHSWIVSEAVLVLFVAIILSG
jgi:hypothetical protein